jgi:hypothetical protein
MANVQIRFSITLQDSTGVEASTYTGVQLTDTTTLAAAAAAYATWADAVADASDCAAVRGSITLLPVVTPAEGKPVEGSSVEKTAILNFKTGASVHRQGFDVPGVAAALLTGRTIKIDTGALRTLIDLMKTSPYTNPYAQLYTAFSDAILAFRRRQKQTERATLETGS